MRIVVDAMGGDSAPAVEVEGAVSALRDGDFSAEVILVGDEQSIRKELVRWNAVAEPGLSVEHAPERIETGHDAAREVRRKKGASISVATRLLKEGKGHGLVSAGSTGAVVASSLLTLGRIEGVRRPAIATFLPSPAGGAVLLDAGANSDCTPGHLLQFGVMGAIYARRIMGREDPQVGLLNIGEESSKGNKLVQNAYPLLESGPFRFVGNVEGRDVFHGGADVVVCDGFVGNIVLKFSESVIHLIMELIRDEVGDDLRHRLGGLLMRPVFRSLSQQLNYEEYGGAPLLGVNGAVIISHGSSSPKAIKNAIHVATRFASAGINDHIRTELMGQDVDQVSQ